MTATAPQHNTNFKKSIDSVMSSMTPLLACIAIMAVMQVAESAVAFKKSPSAVELAAPTPAVVGSKDDCVLRGFTADYASYLQSPYMTTSWGLAASDALQLGPLCASEYSPPDEPLRTPHQTRRQANCGMTVFVDGTHGSDRNIGTLTSPVQTIQYGLALTRGRETATACLYIRAGTYYLGAMAPPHFGSRFESQIGAIALTAVDSGLTISAYNNEEVVLSGGAPLSLSWSLYKNTSAGTIVSAKLPVDIADISQGHFNELYIDATRAVRAKYPNGDPQTHGLYSNPTGFVQSAKNWKSLRPFDAATEIHVSQPIKPNQHFTQYQMGVAGAAVPWNPPQSFWALANPPGGGGSTYVIPLGLEWNPDFSPRAPTWKNPSTGFVYAFHDGYWGSWVFEIMTANMTNNGSIYFGRGGFQEARGSNDGGQWYVDNIFEELDDPNEWFVDSDAGVIYFMLNNSVPAPQTFVASQLPCILSMHGDSVSPVADVTISGLTFTQTSRTLMYDYEVPSGGDWAVHRGGTVFLTGTSGVTLIGNTFRQLGSNGVVISDWNLNATVTDNEFVWLADSGVVIIGQADGIDGVSNTNQPTYTAVTNNLIHEIGIYVKQTAGIVQFLSRASYLAGNAIFNAPRAGININDGFNGGTVVASNVIFNTVRETSDHGPFNSWDRIPYLTMQPQGVDGVLIPTLTPANNTLHHNLLFNSYSSVWPIDHDDGSAYYEDYDNVMIYGGYKEYLGHDKYVHDSIYIFPDGQRYDLASEEQKMLRDLTVSKYSKLLLKNNKNKLNKNKLNNGWGAYCAQQFTAQINDSGYNDYWYNNICILQQSNTPYDLSGCQVNQLSDRTQPFTYNNHFYLTQPINGNYTIAIACNNANGTNINWSLQQWKQFGYESGSTEAMSPGVPTVVEWAKKKLFV